MTLSAKNYTEFGNEKDFIFIGGRVVHSPFWPEQGKGFGHYYLWC
jgi:hypothetical protein